jgi:pimeloyl-ACP methyl ester carboxylesterase
MKRACLLLFSLAFLITACGSGTGSPGALSPPPATPTGESASTSPNALVRPVSFTTSDHLRLSGLVYGHGKTMIICTHMVDTTEDIWIDTGMPQHLATLGYSVLLFDFRGYGASQGSPDPSFLDVDLRAAVSFAQQQGAIRIVLMGASMGGTAALKVAAEVPVTAVISLSSPQVYGVLITDEELKAMKIPKLFLASADDTSFALSANHMDEIAGAPKELKIYPGIAHGTALLYGGPGTEPAQLILRFIEQYAPAA